MLEREEGGRERRVELVALPDPKNFDDYTNRSDKPTPQFRSPGFPHVNRRSFVPLRDVYFDSANQDRISLSGGSRHLDRVSFCMEIDQGNYYCE